MRVFKTISIFLFLVLIILFILSFYRNVQNRSEWFLNEKKNSVSPSCQYVEPTCKNECSPPDTFRIFSYYQNWGPCYTSYATSSAGVPKPEVFAKVLGLGSHEMAFGFCLLSPSDVGGSSPKQISPYLLYSGVPGQNLASFAEEKVLSTQSPFQDLKTGFIQPCRQRGITPFIGLGGWSECTDFGLPLLSGIPSWKSVGTTIAKVCNELSCGIVLDFEHLSQEGFSSRETQLKTFVEMIQGIHSTLDKSLPFHYCTRFNGCISDKHPPITPDQAFSSDNEFHDVMKKLSDPTMFDGIQIMAYDVNARMNYENIFLNFIEDGIPASLLYMGAEIGQQAAGGAWAGADDDLALVQAVRKYKGRGVMLWAVNPNNQVDPQRPGTSQCAFRISPSMFQLYQKALQGETPNLQPCKDSFAVCNDNVDLLKKYDPTFSSDTLQCPVPVPWPYQSFSDCQIQYSQSQSTHDCFRCASKNQSLSVRSDSRMAEL